MRISQPLCEYLESHPSDAQRAYCRVSSQAQLPDVANQKRILEQSCQQQHIAVDEWIMEIGGGMNFKRKQFLRLWWIRCWRGKWSASCWPDLDRLARFAYALLVHLCQSQQCELLVMNTEELSPEHELVQDLITIPHCFSSRLYRLRNYRKALEKAIADDQSTQNSAQSDA